jgi:predicted ATP-dependent serine protease
MIMRKPAKAIKFITSDSVKGLIESIEKGKFFSMYFERVAPKCESCDKSNKKWKGLTHCPVCGAELSLERETLAQKGIENPYYESDKPNGNGVSAKEAIEQGVVKYYDANAKGYRSCRTENIMRITHNGIDYHVIR